MLSHFLVAVLLTCSRSVNNCYNLHCMLQINFYIMHVHVYFVSHNEHKLGSHFVQYALDSNTVLPLYIAPLLYAFIKRNRKSSSLCSIIEPLTAPIAKGLQADAGRSGPAHSRGGARPVSARGSFAYWVVLAANGVGFSFRNLICLVVQ